jgi:hypothetical protein
MNLMSRKGLLAAVGMVLLALLTLDSAGTAAERGPVNLDLEEGELSKVPNGWVQPKPSVEAGYKVQLTDEHPRSGKRCALVSRDAKEETAGFGNLIYGDGDLWSDLWGQFSQVTIGFNFAKKPVRTPMVYRGSANQFIRKAFAAIQE